MEGVGAGDDLVFACAEVVAGVFAGEFEGGFVGFRAGVAEEDFVGEGVFDEAAGEVLRGFGGVDVGDVQSCAPVR